jgi:hypothetical protein
MSNPISDFESDSSAIMDDEDAIRADHESDSAKMMEMVADEDFAAQFSYEFAVSPAAAREMIEYVMETVAPSASVGEAALSDAKRRINHYYEGVFLVLRAMLQRQHSSAAMLRTLDVVALGLEFYSACYGIRVPAELARKHGTSKETINKPLNEFQKELKLLRRAGQRSETACVHMAQARRKSVSLKKSEAK